MSIFVSTGDATDKSGYSGNNKVRFFHDGGTGEYGMQILLQNDTGASTTKGYLAHPSYSNDLAFDYMPVNEPDVLGVVAEAGIATGGMCWIWTHGLVQVWIQSSATAGYFVRSTATGDASTTSGFATAEASLTTPFATDKHFQEVGHCLQGTSATGVALCVLHFN